MGKGIDSNSKRNCSSLERRRSRASLKFGNSSACAAVGPTTLRTGAAPGGTTPGPRAASGTKLVFRRAPGASTPADHDTLSFKAFFNGLIGQAPRTPPPDFRLFAAHSPTVVAGVTGLERFTGRQLLLL